MAKAKKKPAISMAAHTGKAPTKAQLRARTIAAIEKKLGKGRAHVIGDARRAAAAQVTEYIPSGIDVIDHYIIGRGGMPVGRMSEIAGPEGCGKTSLLYTWLASVQRTGGVAALLDPENSFDEERAETMGVDLDELLMLEGLTIEEQIDTLKVTISAHDPRVGPLLLGWDSVAASVSEDALSRGTGDRKVGDIPLLLSDELKKLNLMLPKRRAHLMLMNQVRDKIGVMFGDKTTTPGGRALKFYSSVRLAFFGGKAIKNQHDEHTGKIVTIMGVKNRFAPPFRKARVRFDFDSGYNNIYSTLEHAKRLKLIEPRTGGYKGMSKASVDNYLEALEALEWESTAPIPEEGSEPEEVDDDDAESGDSDEEE